VIDTCGKNYPTLKKIKVLFNQLYDFAMMHDICNKDYSGFVDVARYKDKNPNKFDRNKFSKEELKLANEMAARPLSDEGRERLEGTLIFTIDGESAKDLDDAVSLKKTKDGWQLGVHIADVSSYVPEKCALDRLVMNRGTSVYFTDKVVPMLPECLSNGACSLNAGEEKYALSAIISLDREGNIKRTKIIPSIIKSRLRGVYSEVNRILDGSADADLRAKYKEVTPTLKKMHELYETLASKAYARGYIDMSIDEAAIILDSDGMPTDVVKIERGVAERIIEQFMLTANEAVATLLTEQGIPCVYRVHESPSQDKLESFTGYLKHVGIKYTALLREDATGKDYADVLSEAEEKGLATAVSRTMLRSMMKAKYSEIKAPHFGLGIDCYCHFTSPIRRLSDLATHRIIHKVLIDGKRPESYVSYAKRAARAASETELRALTAERKIENLYKTVYMSEYIGQSFDATVSSVTSFGMFCELENTCEGLIPISEMPGLFMFNENDLTLRCGKLVYRIGDTVRVRLEETDVIRGKLRFSLIL
jgi:ribonuclease R